MRIWIGKEKEGSKNQGDMTMFVESSNLREPNIDLVSELLTHQYDGSNTYLGMIDRIYLGAGKVDVKFINPNSFTFLMELCKTGGVKVTFETSEPNYWLNHTDFVTALWQYKIDLVIRIDAKPVGQMLGDILKNVTYKVDNGKEVFFTNYKQDSNNSIDEVIDGLYAEDQLIFSDYKGENNND